MQSRRRAIEDRLSIHAMLADLETERLEHVETLQRLRDVLAGMIVQDSASYDIQSGEPSLATIEEEPLTMFGALREWSQIEFSQSRPWFLAQDASEPWAPTLSSEHEASPFWSARARAHWSASISQERPQGTLRPSFGQPSWLTQPFDYQGSHWAARGATQSARAD